MKPAFDDIATLVGLQLGSGTVEAGDLLVQDLGAVSADIVNIVVALEDKYSIEIDETALADVNTVADLHRLVEELV